ncbi:MAG: transglutaminase-like cysteine peptidase [Pseudomonadota bacterium]
MKKTKTPLALFVFVTGTIASNPALGFDQPAAMRVGSLTSQPIGHHWYCKEYSSDCSIKSSNQAPPKLTRGKWQELTEVNAYSNNSIRPVTDLEAYNRNEHWAYPVSFGDCEDYVLMKRHMLMQRGWPASALLITVVRQKNGEGHAVLTVRTSKGDFILDNLDGKIRPWHATPYRYLKRQATNHSGKWSEIVDVRS